MGREVSEKSHHSWRSFDDVDTLSITETVYRGEIRLFGKTDGSLTDVHLPPGLAEELRLWEQETAQASPNEVSLQMPSSSRTHEEDSWRLELPKLNFQILRRTMAIQAQSMGLVKDIQAHLRHAKANTTANEYMQELPESVKRMVGEVYAMLTKGGESQEGLQHLPQKAANSSEELAVSI
jgi:integrase